VDGVSEKGPIPDQWLPLFKDKNIDSYRELGRKADLDYTRARRVVVGEGTTDDAVHAVAGVFGITPRRVWELRGEPVPKPFTLPDRAGHLTRKERAAILAVVDSILEAKGVLNGRSSSTPQEPSASAQKKAEEASDGSKFPPLGSRKARRPGQNRAEK